MTYTHLTPNELVIIEAYFHQETPVAFVAKKLKRGRQAIYNVYHFLKQGKTALEYLEQYKKNKKRCGRKPIEIPKSEKPSSNTGQVSNLQNWPVQIKLAPVSAPYFNGAKLLIAADCTAYAYAGFHQDFIRNKVTLIGCPKLDQVDYSEKLTAIIQNNNIQSVTIVRMEVPCCGGLEMAAKKALQNSGKFLPWQVITISIDGKIIE